MLWYKDAVIYELHVRAFRDSDGNGAGDFRGLIEKLDYLQDLGVTALWLLPFYPSPWRDDGYDICDYMGVHGSYGTLQDIADLLGEAHRRGLKVITELVLNHTSDQHPWFQRARTSPAGSRWRDFYVWSDSPDRYRDVRIIFRDFEKSNWTWDAAAGAYYWHRFYSHQPDLNFDSPDVREALIETVDFWLDMGVDGLRLDAVPYLFERAGTNGENLPETHAFLRKLRRHVDGRYGDRMLLAEANQWPEDAVAYFGEGDECHMAFHFPLMPRLFMAHRTEDAFPIIDILEQTPAIPENCQWALFLRNHDELTLEMVREEERDYMYRAYAQDPQMRLNLGIRRRLAPLLGNDRRRIELLNAILFSLPGTPVIYYGDEIGMGDNLELGDRNGVRTPMQWTPGPNAGFSDAPAERLYLPVITEPEYHFETVNVEVQERNPQSLLWWMRNLVALRKHSPALARGSIEFLRPRNRHVLAFVRRHGDESVLAVFNLSRFVQPVQLPLAKHSGYTPVELFGGAEFPPVESEAYPLSLAPYGFYWLRLRAPTAEEPAEGPRSYATLEVSSPEDALAWENRSRIAELLPQFLRVKPWFRDYARTIAGAEMLDLFRLSDQLSALAIFRISFAGGDPETYLLSLSVLSGEAATGVSKKNPQDIIAQLDTGSGETALLLSGVKSAQFADDLAEVISGGKEIAGHAGSIAGFAAPPFAHSEGQERFCLLSAPLQQEQRNSSLVYGDLFTLKLFRRLEPGPNPEVEIGRYLFEEANYGHSAPVAGVMEYRENEGECTTLAVLHAFVENQGNLWSHSLDALGRFLHSAIANYRAGPPEVRQTPLELAGGELPACARDLIAGFGEEVLLLGRRTAELHLALARDGVPAGFAPELSSHFYRQGLYHGMVGLTRRAMELLEQRRAFLPEAEQALAGRILQREPEIRSHFLPVRDARNEWMRIRVHGDLHLNQVLHTGKDFVFIDFEGENTRPLIERRVRHSPLLDVAGLVRSFRYASLAGLFGQAPGIVVRERTRETVQSWCRLWYLWVSAIFLRGYLDTPVCDRLLPAASAELAALFNSFLVSKAAYELQYELNSRPDWAPIALHGLAELLDGGSQP